MSVVVKGMKMPQDCFECDFFNPFVGEPYCRRLLKRCPTTGRLEDCPLGEVPTPHGRLIDADETLHTFSELEPYRKAFEAIALLEAEEEE